jgi:hypothetical protein
MLHIMQIKKDYLILGVVIAAIAVYLNMRSSDRTHYTLPALAALTAADITQIQISGGGKTQTLIRKDGRWVTDPQGFPADPKRVNEMLETLAGLNLTALVAESKNYALYELDPDHTVTVKAWQGDQLKRDIDVGKAAPSFRHTFVKLAGDDRVFHAADNFRFRFESGLDELRDKTVLAFNRRDIREIQITKGTASVTLSRLPPQEEAPPAGQPAPAPAPAAWQGSDGRPADSAAVEMLMGDLVDLQCQAFIDDRDKTAFGAPIYSIALKGPKDHTLSIFAPAGQDSATYPAISSGSDTPFQLPADQAQRLMKDPDEFFKRGEKKEG